MEDPEKMELRHWANVDQTYLKEFFRDQSTAKLTQVTLERDAARVERDKAIADKKIAWSEREAALMQRDAAYTDRNMAWEERDKAITGLTIICGNSRDPDTIKLMQVVNWVANRPPMGSNVLCLPSNGQGMDNKHIEGNPLQRQVKQQAKSGKRETPKKRKASVVASQDRKVSRSSKKKRKQPEGQVKGERIKQEDVCKSLVAYVAPIDLSSTPVPMCSCTGTNRQCYRWGTGSWQSSCCTNFLSVYPLPMSQGKRSSRVAGRKMSAGAFKKLLERLAGAGVDITKPIDLKEHWAKHGTNKYVIVK